MPLTITTFSHRLILGPVSMAVISALIAGCGGGGSSAALNPVAPVKQTSTDQGAAAVTPAKQDKYRIFYSYDRSDMVTGGDTILVTLTVLDKSGNIVPNAKLTLSMGDPAITGLSFGSDVSNAITDASGQFATKVILSAGSTIDYRLNREEQLKVTLDDGIYKPVIQTVPINITGTTFTAMPNPITVPSGGSGIVVLNAVDNKGKPLVGANIQLSGVNYTKTQVSDSKGSASFVISASDIPANGKLSLDAIIYGSDVNHAQKLPVPVVVNKDVAATSNLSITPSTTLAKINDTVTFTITASDTSDIGNQPVLISTTKGGLGSSSAGSVSVQLGAAIKNGNIYTATQVVTLSSKAVGFASVQAELGNYKATSTVEFYSATPQSMALQADQSLVLPNSSTFVSAVVYDNNGAPVKNAVVKFNIEKDPSGGNLSAASAITDSAGKAKVTYTAGSNTTASDAVIIKAIATEGGVATQSTDPTSSLSLTVSGEAVNISIGTDNKLAVKSAYDPTNSTLPTMYVQSFSLIVRDISGRPMVSQPVTIQLNNNTYWKGIYSFDSVTSKWFSTRSIDCKGSHSEPAVLIDASSFGNSSQKITGTTNGQGRFDFEVSYPRNYGTWFKSDLVANTTTVTGQLGKSTLSQLFGTLDADIPTTGARRPDMESPYGINYNNCTIGQ